MGGSINNSKILPGAELQIADILKILISEHVHVAWSVSRHLRMIFITFFGTISFENREISKNLINFFDRGLKEHE